MKWLKNFFAKKTQNNNAKEIVNEFNSKMTHIRQAGSVDGKHYTDSVDLIKELKREGKHQEAIEFLLKSVNATESESAYAGEGWGVAPWYYEQLAIIYRKEKLYHKEVEILERYSKQPKALGAGSEKLASRLIKAKELLAKQKA